MFFKTSDQGGLAVIAHPFNLLDSIAVHTVPNYRFDGIEIPNYNSSDISKILARKFANARPTLFQIGGSDANQPWDLGIVLNLVEASLDTDSILKALKKRRFRVVQL